MVLPANLETLEDLIKEHMAITKKHFEKDGEVTAMCIGYSKDCRILLPLIFETADEKKTILQIMTMIFTVHNVNRYTISSEAWGLDGPPDIVEPERDRLKKEGLMFADSPMRIEMLNCIAISRHETLVLLNIIKADRSIEPFQREYDHRKSSGRLTELLPPVGISDKTMSEIKMFLARAKKIGKFDFDIEEF